MNISEFNLSNVKCAGCVNKIQNKLNTLPEVSNATVNLLDKTLHIEYVREKHDELIIEIVNKIGYGASLNELIEDNDNPYISIILPLLSGTILMMLMMLPSLSIYSIQGSTQAVISFIILGITARKIFISGIKGAIHLNLNMYSLITLGVFSAWIYSTLVSSGILDIPIHTQHLYFDSALMIVGLINLGSYFEKKAEQTTTSSIKTLLKLQPTETTIMVNNIEKSIKTNLLRTEDIVKIRPGEKVPADGIIIEGESYLDESMLSGEAIAIHKKVGNKVIAGSINTNGSFCFSVTAVGANTVLAEIITLVKNAQNSKPKLAKLADKIAAIFVPVIILITLIAAITWYLIGPTPQIFYAISIFMTILIIACPCSVGLAIPTSLMVGLGRSAHHGILIQKSTCLEAITKLGYILLDKTGTITEGKPQVIHIQSNIPNALLVAKSLEQHSEHPLAQAILNYRPEILATDVTHFSSTPGGGVTGYINQIQYYVGNLNWIKEVSNAQNIAQYIDETNHATQVFIANSDSILARIDIADNIKADSAIAIAQLKALGIKVAMVTGDNQNSANYIAKLAGIDQIYADTNPHEKVALVKRLQNEGIVVAFVGDGVNDSPSLTQSDVGIAIGNGADIAIQSADITLIKSSLSGIVEAIAIGRAISRNMRQNLFGSFIYNSIAVVIAAGALYPTWHILLNPIIASIAMSLSSITVVANANRLRNL